LSAGASRKHRDLLQLEESLFEKRKAGRVIAASQMVVNEITDLYRYPADKIDVVRNGVPLDKFRFDPGLRERSRAELKLKQDQIVLLVRRFGLGAQRLAVCNRSDGAAAKIEKCGCWSPAGAKQGRIKRRACGSGARIPCSFSAKFQTLWPVLRGCGHLHFARQCTTPSRMPASKRWPAGYQ
jgi:hypothetical protein